MTTILQASLRHKPTLGLRRRREAGFTLLESVLAFALLAAVSAGLLAVQPQVFRTQNGGRDQLVGLELARGCAERLLAVRRQLGYAQVTSSLCDGMGGVGVFAANPSVTLTAADGSSVTSCTSATCTAAIVVSRSTGTGVSPASITLQFSSY
jgi:type II secretory pathway pseudopilin PulG